jgi:beta-glucosidase
MKVTSTGKYDVEVTFTIKNSGNYDAAEIVQVYVASQTGGVYRPARELKGFAEGSLRKDSLKMYK